MKNRLWDAFCISTLVGIWPRFIEPNLVGLTQVSFPLLKTPFKIVQLSDLHFNSDVNQRFLDKILRKIDSQKPDLIALTGDFLCYGTLEDPKLLRTFLKRLKCRYGVYAVLGNHDYHVGLSINKRGDYDVLQKVSSPILNRMKRLIFPQKVTGSVTKAALEAKPNQDLLQILKESSVSLLNNETVQIDEKMNLVGLGELMNGSVDPEKAFRAYDPALPGVILVHNPDAALRLEAFPGNLILSGHTHGGEINLPWLWRRFTAMENPTFKSGLYPLETKSLYISRGLGGTVPFRFNASPEIVSIQV